MDPLTEPRFDPRRDLDSEGFQVPDHQKRVDVQFCRCLTKERRLSAQALSPEKLVTEVAGFAGLGRDYTVRLCERGAPSSSGFPWCRVLLCRI